MHIKTANGKKKVVISRKEWETIGKKAGWTEDKVSDCCGAEDGPTSLDGPFWSDIGVCPDCREHCEFIEPEEEFVICPDCSGNGTRYPERLDSSPCKRCRGTGELKREPDISADEYRNWEHV